MAYTLDVINNYVAVELLETVIKEDAILRPGITEKETRWGKALKVGPGIVDLFGKKIPMVVNEGDLVYVMAHGKEKIDGLSIGQKDAFIVASELDVLCTMKDNEKYELQPLGSYIEIEKMEAPEKTLGGIILPDSKKKVPNCGTVIKLGTGWKSADGHTIPFHVQEGDFVAFLPFRTMLIDMSRFGQPDRHIIMHSDIMGKLVKKEDN